MRRHILILGVCLMLPSGALAQDSAPEDALWLAFAPLLERALLEAPPEPDGLGNFEVNVPPEWLDTLEAQFGATPEYWELRWWCAEAAGDPEAAAWLRRGAEHTPLRFAGAAMLYKAETVSDVGAEQRLALLDGFISAHPDESWLLYQRALARYDLGDWDAMLADFEAGNAAARNRLPLPFPWSYVHARLADEEPPAYDAAAGIVTSQSYMLPFPSSAGMRRVVKEQENRLAAGAPISEVAALHGCSCRMGHFEGVTMLHQLSAIVRIGALSKYLLVEMPDQFTSEQRNELWSLNGRNRRISTLLRYDPRRHGPRLPEFLEMTVAEQGISFGQFAEFVIKGDPGLYGPEQVREFHAEMADTIASTPEDVEWSVEFRQTMLDADPIYKLRERLLPDFFRWHLTRAAVEDELVREQTDDFRRLGSFDWVTISFPDLPEED